MKVIQSPGSRTRILCGLLVGAGIGAALSVPFVSVGIGVGVGAGIGLLVALVLGRGDDTGERQAASAASPGTIPVGGDAAETAGWVWNELVPKSGQSDTVQGELLRAIEKLRWEAQNNGNVNWDVGFERLLGFLEAELTGDAALAESDRVAASDDVGRLREHADPYLEDDLYDRLTDVLVAYCRAHPEPIARAADPELDR